MESPGDWLDDPYINRYVKLINDECGKEGVYASGSFELHITNGRQKGRDASELMERQCASIRKRAKLEDMKKWIIPINQENIHWKLAVVMIREHLIVFYDSISNGPPSIHMECADTIRLLLRSYGRIYSIKSFQTRPWISVCLNAFSSLQTDAMSCGIYCLTAAELNSHNPDVLIYDICMGDVRYRRYRIDQAIVRGHLCETPCASEFCSIRMRPATDEIVYDPHFYADRRAITRGMRYPKKRLGTLRKVKSAGKGAVIWNRYSIPWNVTDKHMLSLYQAADRCADKINLETMRICVRMSGRPMMFGRMLLSNLVSPSKKIWIHVICEHAGIKDIGVSPLDDADPQSLIFSDENYLEIAQMSEEIHSLRQTVGEMLESMRVSRYTPKDPCDLYLTCSQDPSDPTDIEMRLGPVREAKGYSIHCHEFESIQMATCSERYSPMEEDREEGIFDTCSISRCLYPCYLGERVERLSFFSPSPLINLEK